MNISENPNCPTILGVRLPYRISTESMKQFIGNG
jgi:hypothetical protein